MKSYFDVEGSDIAALDDSDLRELVGRLCEVEARKAEIDASGILWGGNQDAVDSGIDVHVDVVGNFSEGCVVPNSLTGIQVKKPKMAAKAISDEMCPKGELRVSIAKIIQEGGAYLIISSGDSVTQSAYQKRIAAMKNCMPKDFEKSGAGVDFLDQNRMATWVRQHPSLISWVRKKIGRSLDGWKPLEKWANPLEKDDSEYLLGEGTHIFIEGNASSGNKISILEGINHMRSVLAKPQKSLRLVGLSGVGKTRLLQALFDDRIGDGVLSATSVYYTDLGDSPDPDPYQFVEDLQALGYEGTVIVDNCGRDLHRKLSSLILVDKSKLSLVTVEYDVGDHVPEETHVIRLEPTEDVLIAKLLDRDFPHLGTMNAHKIAEVAGGNFRIAISIARTIDSNESLGVLRDEDLFLRLFQQGNDADGSLVESAELLSLLYSFDGENISEGSELFRLAKLGEVSPLRLYRNSVTIKNRELIQSRGKWRAVLPHAIANNLARRSLENFPVSYLVENLIEKPPERIIKSFSHRLNYLHDSKVAHEVVRAILHPEGWLGRHLHNLNNLGVYVFKNIAPVSPEATLMAIENAARVSEDNQFTQKNSTNSATMVRVLCHLAYDDEFFVRSTKLLIEFALSEKDEDNSTSSIRKRLCALFYVNASCSMALLETKKTVLLSLLEHDDAENRLLGRLIIKSCLSNNRAYVGSTANFGVRIRETYGYRPKTWGDYYHWIGEYLDILVERVLTNTTEQSEYLGVLAEVFPDVWHKSYYEKLYDAAIEISKKISWVDGWRAAKSILYYSKDKQSEESIKCLEEIIERLKPTDIEDRIRVYVLCDRRSIFNIEDDFNDVSADNVYEKIHKIACTLGEECSDNFSLIRDFAVDLVTDNGCGLLGFGEGLANKTSSARDLWRTLLNAVKQVSRSERNGEIFSGIMKALNDRGSNLYDELLNEVSDDDEMICWFIGFASHGGFDRNKIEKLIFLIKSGKLSSKDCVTLSYGRRHESIGNDDFIQILKAIESGENGKRVALDILSMRFHRKVIDDYEEDSNLFVYGRELLLKVPFETDHQRSSSLDYDMASVIRLVLAGETQRDLASAMFDRIYQLEDEIIFHHNEYAQSLEVLIQYHPKEFLDACMRNQDRLKKIHYKIDCVDGVRGDSPLDSIEEEQIFEWCLNDETDVKIITISHAIRMFREDEDDSFDWTKLALFLLENHSDPKQVFDIYMDRLQPNVWSGSRADILQNRIPLIEKLVSFKKLEAFVEQAVKSLRVRIEEERKWESEKSRRKDEAFE